MFSEGQRHRSFSAAGRTKNNYQKWIAFQSARTPVDVVPGSRDGNDEDEQSDSDETERLQSPDVMSSSRISLLIVLGRNLAAHEAIVVL